MKLLILSSNNGGGHNAVADAISEYYKSHGHEVDIRDGLSFLSRRVSSAIASLHVFLYRNIPEAGGDAFGLFKNKDQKLAENTMGRRIVDLGSHSLAAFITDNHYDCVICTHVFPAAILTTAVKNYHLSVRTGFVETDYCNNPGYAGMDVDVHFLSHESLIPECIHAGIPREKLVVSGIPVKPRLIQKRDPRASRRLFGIPEDHRHILMMSGSMGCGPIPELIALLSKRVDSTVDISVVCGSNHKMKRDLEDRFSDYRNIHVFGYIPDMSWLYASADIFVTKPGGVSTTEAVVSGLPLVLINIVRGCEEYNLKFFLDRGAALSGKNETELADCCTQILLDDRKRASMAEAQHSIAIPDSLDIIYNHL